MARPGWALTILVDKSKKIHRVLFKRTNLLEDSFIKFMLGEMQLSSPERRGPIAGRVELFEKTVLLHFNLEEQLLFPLYQKKSPQIKQATLLFSNEHQRIIETFERYKQIDDRKQMIKALSVLMSSLALHTRSEDIFFSSIPLKEKEAAKVSVVARAIGFPIL